MRFDIQSRDRLGITQEILAVISSNQWNLSATEMHLHHTFVHVEGIENVDDFISQVSEVEGVSKVLEVSFLPGERKSQHLDAVLSHLDEPIIDIDNEGKLLLVNTSAAKLFKINKDHSDQHLITDFCDCELGSLLPDHKSTIEVACMGANFLADITPVSSYSEDGVKETSGAVLFLRTFTNIGQQISAITHSLADGALRLVGSSPAVTDLTRHIQRFSQLDLPVLIQGETGTGKELIARLLHEQGSRSEQPFLAINCAALPESLLESELFGYSPGAFSGANKSGKPGLFELANGGSVFLDEIGEMSPYLQAKLLRVLQEYSFRRIGGNKEITVNVRIISATHRDLIKMSESNEFREDLYYRLNVLQLTAPPLRKRKTDIPELVSHFTLNAAKQTNKLSKISFTDKALALLKEYDWPGNVRELQNAIFRAVAMSETSEITDDLLLSSASVAMQEPSQKASSSLKELINAYEKEVLEELYPQYPSSRKLAKQLGISHNSAAMKLRKYGINED